jgi:hypothetical protein
MKTMCAGIAAAMAVTSGAAAQETLYGLSNPTSPILQRLDPATGAVLDTHAVTGQEALFGGLAESGGVLYSIDGYNDPNSDRLFRIDPATGAGSVVGPTGFNWNFRCLTRNPATGVMFAQTDNQLYTMNLSTGAATLVAAITAPANLDQVTAMAINQQGQAFCTDIGDTDLYSLNLATGQATWIGSVGQSGNWFEDLAFDSTGRLWGCRVSGGVYTIDLVTAAQTLQFGGSYNGLVFVGGATCYANCDGSTTAPILNVNDFVCFQSLFAAGNTSANCDGSTPPPVLNVNDFVCFQAAFAAGCP